MLSTALSLATAATSPRAVTCEQCQDEAAKLVKHLLSDERFTRRKIHCMKTFHSQYRGAAGGFERGGVPAAAA